MTPERKVAVVLIAGREFAEYACLLRGGPRDGVVHNTIQQPDCEWPNGLPPKIVYPDQAGGIAVYIRRPDSLEYDYIGKRL